MNKRISNALAWLEAKQSSLESTYNNRKGNQLVAIAAGVGAFAIGLITVALVAVIVTSLQSASGVTVNGTAWTILNNTLTMMLNFSSQLGLAGTVLGFVVIFGGLAYLGYFAYQNVAGHSR